MLIKNYSIYLYLLVSVVILIIARYYSNDFIVSNDLIWLGILNLLFTFFAGMLLLPIMLGFLDIYVFVYFQQHILKHRLLNSMRVIEIEKVKEKKAVGFLCLVVFSTFVFCFIFLLVSGIEELKEAMRVEQIF